MEAAVRDHRQGGTGDTRSARKEDTGSRPFPPRRDNFPFLASVAAGRANSHPSASAGARPPRRDTLARRDLRGAPGHACAAPHPPPRILYSDLVPKKHHTFDFYGPPLPIHGPPLPQWPSLCTTSDPPPPSPYL